MTNEIFSKLVRKLTCDPSNEFRKCSSDMKKIPKTTEYKMAMGDFDINLSQEVGRSGIKYALKVKERNDEEAIVFEDEDYQATLRNLFGEINKNYTEWQGKRLERLEKALTYNC